MSAGSLFAAFAVVAFGTLAGAAALLTPLTFGQFLIWLLGG